MCIDFAGLTFDSAVAEAAATVVTMVGIAMTMTATMMMTPIGIVVPTDLSVYNLIESADLALVHSVFHNLLSSCGVRALSKRSGDFLFLWVPQ